MRNGEIRWGWILKEEKAHSKSGETAGSEIQEGGSLVAGSRSDASEETMGVCRFY